MDNCEMMNMNARLRTFKQWPFKDDCSCTPERMAEAGFYCCGGDNEPDLVRCYICRRELDGWEPDDDPWKEHARGKGGKCPYINLGKKPAELTVADVLGTLEPEKHMASLRMALETYRENAKQNLEKSKKKIDKLAPKKK